MNADGMKHMILHMCSLVECCAAKTKLYYELELFEVGESDDWDFVDWRDFRFNDDKESDDGISLVWPNFRAFDMCFTYGVEAEVEAERGEIVYLVLNDYTELGTAADM